MRKLMYAMMYYTLLLLMFIGNYALAKGKSKGLAISGEISGLTAEDDSVTLSVWDNPNLYYTVPDQTYKAAIKSGRFKIAAPVFYDYAYFKISYPSSSVLPMNVVNYLGMSGDVVLMKISPEKVVFSGKNEALYNCQSKASRMRYASLDSEFREKMNPKFSGDAYDQLSANHEIAYKLYSLRVSILDSYKDKMSSESYKILKANYLGQAYYDLSYQVRMAFTLDRNQKDSLFLGKFYHYYDDFLKKDSFMQVDDPLVLEKSMGYTDNLYQMEYLKQIFEYGMTRYGFVKMDLGIFYKHLKYKFSGVLKDRLITKLFIEYFKGANMFGGEHYLEEATRDVKEPYKNMLTHLKTSQYKGSPFYPFALEDVNGHTVTLENLRGKVLVLDFWFTGCTGCKHLAEAMRPVHEYYRDRKDVVFISISVDKDKLKWKKSVAGGLYTDAHSLNLYTNGLGEKHPMLSHYNFSGYPQLMIVDAEGKMFESRPQRPTRAKPGEEGLGENTKAFMMTLNDVLMIK